MKGKWVEATAKQFNDFLHQHEAAGRSPANGPARVWYGTDGRSFAMYVDIPPDEHSYWIRKELESLTSSSLDARLDRTLSAGDAMYSGNSTHYFSCGRSALTVVNAAITLAGIDPPQHILDFGAGAGRVTRWLVAAFPAAAVHACDIRREDMEFLRDHFHIDAWTVEPDVEQIDLLGQYDVIWVGSVITHLSEERTTTLLRKLLAACNRGGLLIASFHGRYAVERQELASLNYIHPDGWAEIITGLKARGYGYADYEGNPGYGISVTDLCWMADLAKSLGAKIVLLGERLWDGHHDVVALLKS